MSQIEAIPVTIRRAVDEIVATIEKAAVASGTPSATRMTILDFVAAVAIHATATKEHNSKRVLAMHRGHVRMLLDELEER